MQVTIAVEGTCVGIGENDLFNSNYYDPVITEGVFDKGWSHHHAVLNGYPPAALNKKTSIF